MPSFEETNNPGMMYLIPHNTQKKKDEINKSLLRGFIINEKN